jgi:quercetin dioxygenase-like cupin family protein
MPRIVNAAEAQWGDHARFAGIQMKALLTRADNELANVSQVRVPPGCEVGWHAHATQVETVYLLAGQAVLVIGTGEAAMTAGSIVAIPAGAEHSLRNIGNEPVELIAFFTPPNS